jgi:hypothetical protein
VDSHADEILCRNAVSHIDLIPTQYNPIGAHILRRQYRRLRIDKDCHPAWFRNCVKARLGTKSVKKYQAVIGYRQSSDPQIEIGTHRAILARSRGHNSLPQDSDQAITLESIRLAWGPKENVKEIPRLP